MRKKQNVEVHIVLKKGKGSNLTFGDSCNTLCGRPVDKHRLVSDDWWSAGKVCDTCFNENSRRTADQTQRHYIVEQP